MTQLSNEWAAGFFEGEGWVCVSKRILKSGRTRYQIRCGITNTEIVLLEKFQMAYGGSIRARKGTALSRKPLWEWTVCDKSAEPFLRSIEPHVSGKKKHVIEGALALRRRMVGKRRTDGCMATLDVNEITARDSIILDIRQHSKSKGGQ